MSQELEGGEGAGPGDSCRERSRGRGKAMGYSLCIESLDITMIRILSMRGLSYSLKPGICKQPS